MSARMIPPYLSSDVKSAGERTLFCRLRDDPATDGWTVLHSLNIARHVSQVEGEIDFVILVPNLGVLCLEVKGTSRVRRREGVWYYGHDPNGDPRGPFQQAAEGRYSVFKQVKRYQPALARIPFWSAVAFPFVEFTTRSTEWHDWQVIDRRSMSARPISDVISLMLQSGRHHLTTARTVKWFDPERRTPTEQECDQVLAILRPSFEVIESARGLREREQAELRVFTEEQYAALDAMADNPQVIFDGPAGSGKTVLGLEAVRRAASRSQSTLFLCYNRLLGRWLSSSTVDLEGVKATTLHRHMLDLVEASGLRSPNLPENPNPQFWRAELPQLAIEAMIEAPEAMCVFDTLVIDEAQDVLRPRYLDFLDLSLQGGLGTGRLRMFGDFERQDIYRSGNDRSVLNQLGASRYRLSVNCRNTPRVAAWASLFGGLEPDYSRVLRSDDGRQPVLKFYKDEPDRRILLAQSLDELADEGFRGNDIVVLSTKRRDSTAAKLRARNEGHRLAPIEARSDGQVSFTTIHAFKGLDSPAVVLTDLESVTGSLAQDLFYVGVTRALHRLHVIASATVRTEMLELLT